MIPGSKSAEYGKQREDMDITAYGYIKWQNAVLLHESHPLT